jgi:glutathione synthase/RimK-type ligase-like ATP-grasp enzyme
MNKQILIVRTKNGTKYAERIASEIKNLGVECNAVYWDELEEFLDTHRLTPESTVLHFRAAGPSANPKAFELERVGYRIINPAKVLDRTSDKYKSFDWARKQGANLPTTKKGTRDAIKRSIDTLPFRKFVVKPINSKNQGALCFPSFKGDLEIDEKLSQVPGEEIILQQYVEYFRIYRVIVIGGVPVAQAVFYDEPTPERWKVSVCLNPEIRHEPNPDPALLTYAKNLADIFESEIAFVDVFQTKDGYVLSEINTACNLSQHESKSGCNIAKKIAQYLVAQLRGSTVSRSSD